MAELFKNVYDGSFICQLSDIIQEFYPEFDSQDFEKQIFDKNWEQKELKERMRHITYILHRFLTDDYRKDVTILKEVLAQFGKRKIGIKSLERMIFPDYIEVYGLEDYAFSVKSLEFITQFFSAEFAVRPFLEKYPELMFPQMLAWSKHENEQVRRLSSEGFRPRLPWGRALKNLKKDPSPILPVLENLMQDKSETVRRSVANNLNDISKDHPKITLEFAQRYQGLHPDSDWIIKHACRTLLKKANPTALEIFGFSNLEKIQILDLETKTPTVLIGGNLKFSFAFQHCEEQKVKIRIEYGIDYLKSNGQHSRKVFKITENSYLSNTIYTFERQQSFRQMTTRKHYTGIHRLHLVLNGEVMKSIDFEVIAKTGA